MFYINLIMEDLHKPFTSVEARTLLSLFQTIPKYERFEFNNFNVTLNELHQLVYEITLIQNQKSKRLIKTKKNIANFCSQIGQRNLQIPQVGPIDSQRLKAYLNDIYLTVRDHPFFKLFKGQLTITLQNQEKLKVNSLYYGPLTQTKLIDYAEIDYSLFGSQQPRYFVITQSSAYLLKQLQKSSQLKQSLIIDPNFSYSFPYLSEKKPSLKIMLFFSQKQIQLMAPDIQSFIILAYFIKLTNANMPSRNSHSSFAPTRKDSQIDYFIDGKDYFQSLYKDLLNAQRQVYITGWRISPTFRFTRNQKQPQNLQYPQTQESSEFQKVLKKIAEERKVKIYILLYNAPWLVPSKPDFVYKRLRENPMTKVPNIQILLHPRIAQTPWRGLTIASTHHEKLVVIDKKIAYMGGFDIAFGRYDDNTHRISDINRPFTWPGADYCNQRIIDNPNPDKPDEQIKLVKRAERPRMPWHDIGAKLSGPCMKHLQAHFTQYWSHAASTYSNIRLPFQINQMAQIENFSESFDQQEKQYERIAESLDIFKQAKIFFQQQQKDTTGQCLLQVKQQIIKILKGQRQIQNNSRCVKPEDYQPIEEHSAQTQAAFINISTERCQVEQESFINESAVQKGSIYTQILRSSCNWSLGLHEKKIQHSIMNAYKELISNAQRYIYIQNQFFMSQANEISKCIVEKIVTCHKAKIPLKVIVMLPALPGLSGNPDDTSLFIMIRLTLDTINDMYNKLADKIGANNIENYLYFFSLRTHDKIGDKLVTEIVYIHSKLMIVDDRYVIIGSANINNRSMLGDRDSQLAVVIEDTREDKELAIGLLNKLIQQHFKIDLPAGRFTEQVWRDMIAISQQNHNIYKKIFKCYPDNDIKKLSDLNLNPNIDKDYYEKNKDNIRGNAIPYQRFFLKEQERMTFNGAYWFKWALRDRLFT